MKTPALFAVLILLVETIAAEDFSREAIDCRALVASIRPPADEGEQGTRYLDDADRAYRDCRGAKLPLDVRVKALLKYAMASDNRGKHQTATATLAEALDLLDRAGGDNTALLIDVLDKAASVETRAGLQADATAHAKRAVDARTKKYGQSSTEAVEGLVKLAMVHATFKEYENSETLLRDAIRVAEKACGPECDALVFAYSGMEAFYEAQGNTAEAKKYSELGLNAAPTRRRKD